MGFAVTLNDTDIDAATRLNKLREEYTTNPIPPRIADGDLVGCTAEVALCKAWGLSYDVLGYDHGGTGDGGIDFQSEEVSVDLKSSHRYAGSWLVKRTEADWYIFAYVEMPYTVHFLGKLDRERIKKLPMFQPVPGTRRVKIEDLIPFNREDFPSLQDPEGTAK